MQGSVTSQRPSSVSRKRQGHEVYSNYPNSQKANKTVKTETNNTELPPTPAAEQTFSNGQFQSPATRVVWTPSKNSAFLPWTRQTP